MRTLLTLLLFSTVLTNTARADTASALDEYFTRLTAHGFSGAVIVALFGLTLSKVLAAALAASVAHTVATLCALP